MHLCTLHIHVHVFITYINSIAYQTGLIKWLICQTILKYNIRLQSAIQVLGSVGFSAQTTAILFSERLEIYVSDIFGFKFETNNMRRV